MIKIIAFLITLCFNFSFANTIIINDYTDMSYLLTSKYQDTYIDKTKKLNIKDVRNLDKFKKIDKVNFRASRNIIWIKFSIKNELAPNKEMFFENDRPLIDIIDIYIFKDNKLHKKLELGDTRKISNRKIKGRKSTFSLLLDRNTTYTFYIKAKSYSSISTNWRIEDRTNYINNISFELIIWGAYLGIILALVLFYMILFILFHEISFIVYSALGISSLIYLFYINGFYYQYFDYLNNKYLSNLNYTFGYLSQALVILFPIVFFKPKKDSFIFKYLFTFFLLNIMIVIFFLFSIVNPELKYFTKYTDFITMLTIPTLIFISIWALKNKFTGSIYYFLAQGASVAVPFYAVFILIGYFEPIKFMWLIILPLSVIFDMIFLSFALFEKMKKIERERIENMQLVISQSRFSTLGQTTADLTHQWKTPITHLGSQINLLKAVYSLDKKNFEDTFVNTLPEIENSLNFLNHTMDDIYNFYSNPSSKEEFNLSVEIDSVLRIVENNIKKNNIEIVKEYIELIYYGFKGSLINAILAIIENAIFQLTNYKINNRKIFITIKKRDDNIVITIEDNAGGIKSSNFEKLFEIDYSSKNEKGSGLGLTLAKKLIMIRLKGNIIAYNSINGAVFEITFPKN